MDRITADRISDAMKQKGVSGKCPRCNQGKFIVFGVTDLIMGPSDGGWAYPKINFKTFEAKLEKIKLPVAVLSCEHCGYIMNHDLRSLMNEKAPIIDSESTEK